MIKVLVVEDDYPLNQGIQLSLAEDGVIVQGVHSYQKAKEKMRAEAFDLYLLDISLPDGSGLDLCREIRATSDAFVVFITSNDLEVDIVTGLAVGADDYITKPFSLAVLRSKIRAILRRVRVPKGSFVFDDFRFDFPALSFWHGQTPLYFSATEVKLLYAFLQHSGQTLSREQLQETLWGAEEAAVDENALSVAVGRLRSKLKELEKKEYIKTVYGLGYRWESLHE